MKNILALTLLKYIFIGLLVIDGAYHFSYYSSGTYRVKHTFICVKWCQYLINVFHFNLFLTMYFTMVNSHDGPVTVLLVINILFKVYSK